MKLSLIWKKKKEIKPELNWRRGKKTCSKLSEYHALSSLCGCVGCSFLNHTNIWRCMVGCLSNFAESEHLAIVKVKELILL